MKQTQQRIRPMVVADLKTVLVWRNHPEVRRYMYTQHEISHDEHRRWFKRTSQNPHQHLLIYEEGSVAMGFINLHQIAPGGIANWGFYAAPGAVKGTGRALGIAALHYAFTYAGLHKLCGQAIACNERSAQFHLTLGFKQEGILRQHHFDGQQYHDVLCFGMIANEWQAED